jgi:hypothetical protein
MTSEARQSPVDLLSIQPAASRVHPGYNAYVDRLKKVLELSCPGALRQSPLIQPQKPEERNLENIKSQVQESVMPGALGS